MITDPVRYLVVWPLRQLGLVSSRAIENAKLTPQRKQAAQIEQFAYIASRIAAVDENVAVLTQPIRIPDPGTDADETNQVEAVVFRHGELTRVRIALDPSVLAALYGSAGQAETRRSA